jgi:rubrerythrin
MEKDFFGSETKINLLKAFAGESQARNRYTFAASAAKKEGLGLIEKLFLFTADQEKEHAKVFYKFLKPFAGENISIYADYPVDIFETTAEHLRKAQKNEFAESDVIYKGFGEKAKEEGYEEISDVFLKISEIERVHGERFGRFADLSEKGILFSSKEETKWICLNCGNIYNGFGAPETCPVCEHPRGYYIKEDLVYLG